MIMSYSFLSTEWVSLPASGRSFIQYDHLFKFVSKISSTKKITADFLFSLAFWVKLIRIEWKNNRIFWPNGIDGFFIASRSQRERCHLRHRCFLLKTLSSLNLFEKFCFVVRQIFKFLRQFQLNYFADIGWLYSRPGATGDKFRIDLI